MWIRFSETAFTSIPRPQPPPMWRSTFTKIASIATALLLVLQHIPLNHTGGGHSQCIHCTSTYCTKDHRGAHDHGESGRGTALQPTDGAKPAHAHDPHDAGHHSTQEVSATHSPHESQFAESSSSAVSHTQMETCGSGPLGVILITLDKFFPPRSGLKLPATADLSFPEAASVRPRPIFTDDIFHPPAARI